MIQQHTKAIAVDGAGAATVYVGECIRGYVHAVRYTPGTLDTGTKIVLTGAVTGSPILTKDGPGTSVIWYFPMVACAKTADASASTVSESRPFVYMESIKVVVTEGVSGAGSITVYVDEEV